MLRHALKAWGGVLQAVAKMPEKFSASTRLTPGDPRATKAAKRSCPQMAKGVPIQSHLLGGHSPGSEAAPFQDHPAWVPGKGKSEESLEIMGTQPMTWSD